MENISTRIEKISFSPIRDPVTARNHYEVLLEGAIQMYSSQDDLMTPLPTKDFSNYRKDTKRESRGKSAELIRFVKFLIEFLA